MVKVRTICFGRMGNWGMPPFTHLPRLHVAQLPGCPEPSSLLLLCSDSPVPRPGVSFLQICCNLVHPSRPCPRAFSSQQYLPDSGRINLSIFWAGTHAASPNLLEALCPVYLVSAVYILPVYIWSSLYLATNKLNDCKSSPFSIWASVFPSLYKKGLARFFSNN